MTPNKQDGFDAAMRQGKHKDVHPLAPAPNPHKPGTTLWAEWSEGFSEALRIQLDEIKFGGLV